MGKLIDYRIVTTTDEHYRPPDGSVSTHTLYAVQYLWEYKTWFGLGNVRRVWKLCCRDVFYSPGWTLETFSTREAAALFIERRRSPPKTTSSGWTPIAE